MIAGGTTEERNGPNMPTGLSYRHVIAATITASRHQCLSPLVAIIVATHGRDEDETFSKQAIAQSS